MRRFCSGVSWRNSPWSSCFFGDSGSLLRKQTSLQVSFWDVFSFFGDEFWKKTQTNPQTYVIFDNEELLYNLVKTLFLAYTTCEASSISKLLKVNLLYMCHAHIACILLQFSTILTLNKPRWKILLFFLQWMCKMQTLCAAHSLLSFAYGNTNVSRLQKISRKSNFNISVHIKWRSPKTLSSAKILLRNKRHLRRLLVWLDGCLFLSLLFFFFF